MVGYHCKMSKIKHLVLSGGCIWGFSTFGVLYEAMTNGFLDMSNVETIHATSVGTIVGAMVSLKIDPTQIRDYLIKRPWEVLCKKNKYSILDIFQQKGMIHVGFFENMFAPLLKSVDLDPNITLCDLFEYTGIDMHLYATELNSFALVDLSHRTHGTWRLVDAVYVSCTIPILFTPRFSGTDCFLDGGFLLNYPLSKCIAENPDEILGVCITTSREPVSQITADSNVLDFISRVLGQVANLRHEVSQIPYEIVISQDITIEKCLNVLYNKDERERLIYNGIDMMKSACETWGLDAIDKLD